MTQPKTALEKIQAQITELSAKIDSVEQLLNVAGNFIRQLDQAVTGLIYIQGADKVGNAIVEASAAAAKEKFDQVMQRVASGAEKGYYQPVEVVSEASIVHATELVDGKPIPGHNIEFCSLVSDTKSISTDAAKKLVGLKVGDTIFVGQTEVTIKGAWEVNTQKLAEYNAAQQASSAQQGSTEATQGVG